MPEDPIYKTKDGQQVTHQQLIASGYDEDRIGKGVGNGILTKVGDTNAPDQIFKTKDGQTVTYNDLIGSGYDEGRINKGIQNGILLAEPAKKKVTSTDFSNPSIPTYLQQAISGNFPSPSGGRLKSDEPKSEIPKEEVSQTALSASDPIKYVLSPLREQANEANKKLQSFGEFNPYAGAESVRQKGYGLTPQIQHGDTEKTKAQTEQQQSQQQLQSMAQTMYDQYFHNGKDAKAWVANKVANTLEKDRASLADNETIQVAMGRAEDYDKLKSTIGGDQGLTIENAAYQDFLDRNKHFANNLAAVNKEGYSSEGSTQFIPETTKIGIISNYLQNHKGDIEELSKEDPTVKSDYEDLKNNLLTKYPEGASTIIANKLSRARQEMGLNSYVANFDTKTFQNNLDKIAASILTPQEKQIYEQNKAAIHDKVDLPAFVNRFEGGIEKGFQGTRNTINAMSDTPGYNIYRSMQEDANRVSAGEKGWAKSIGTMGDMTGLVTYMAMLGKYSSDKAVVATTFFGDQLKEADAKYEGNRAKAITSAVVNTAGYMVLPDIVPAGKVSEVLGGIKKEVSKSLESLADKNITAETLKAATESGIKKGLEYSGAFAKQHLRSIAEMAILNMANQTTDKALGLNDETYNEYHPAGELGDVIKMTAVANLIPSLLGGYKDYAKRNFDINAVYDFANNPKRALSTIDGMDISPEAKQDLIDKVNYLSQTLPELQKKGISESNQKRFLYEGLLQKTIAKNTPQTPDSAILRSHEKEINRHEEIKDRILNGEDVQGQEPKFTIETPEGEATQIEDTKQKAIDELDKEKEKVRSHVGDAVDNNKEGALDYVAQQALNLDEKGQPHNDGKEKESFDRATEEFGKPLVDAAVEYYQSKQQPERKSTAVIMPEENKVAEIIPLKKETNETPQVPNQAAETGAATTAANKVEQPTEEGTPPPGGPGQPPKQTITSPEGGELVGITHAQTDAIARELGLETYEKNPQTVAGWDAEADRRLQNSNAIPNLVNSIELGHRPTEVETRMGIKYIASLKARINENPTADLLREFTKAKSLFDVAGTQAGRELRARQGSVPPADTLADYLVDRGNDKGRPLSDDQIKNETQKYNELKKAKDDLQAALEKEQEKYSRMAAEHGITKTKAAAKKASKKSHEDYVAERKGAIEAAREALKGIRTGTSGTTATIPGVQELAVIAPHVKKYVESLVNEGVDKLDEIISDVHNQFKDVLDGLTKRQVLDLVAGEHDEKPQTKAQKNAQLRLVKREAGLLKDLQDARKGLEKEKSEKGKDEKTRRIQDLENKIKEVRGLNKEKESDLPFELTEEEEKNYTENEKRQKSLTTKAKQLESDIKNKKFAPEEKPPVTFAKSKKTQDLEDKVIELEQRKAVEKYKDQQQKRGKWEKAYDTFQQIAGTRRLVQTAVDWSILLRQTGTIAFNPRKWGVFAKEVAATAKSTFSQKNFDRLMYAIHKAPDYKDMVEDGIRFNEFETGAIRERNELYPRNWVYKIPILREPILASQRAADSALNTARYELYQKYKKNLIDNGVTRQSDPKVYQEMAKWVMNNTGSGNMLKMLENPAAEKVLGNTFYGSRLMASNFNLLNPVYYARMPKEIRAHAWKDIASYTVTMMATAAGLAAAGGSVQLDPDKSDFLQVRFGNNVYDISGGKAAYVRTALRVLEAGKARLTSSKYEANKKLDFAGSSLMRFFRNKLAPNTSYVIDALSGKNAIGQDFDPTDIIRVYPMYVDDAVKAFKQDGFLSLITSVAPNIMGIGYGNYYYEPKDQPIQDLIKRNVRSDETDLSKLKNYKQNGRLLTDVEKKDYADKRDAEIERRLNILYDKGLPVVEDGKIVTKPFKDLTRDQIIKETSSIKAIATDKVKEELFGKEKKTRQEKIEETKLSREKKKHYSS